MIERIVTICLPVSDIKKSSKWYQELLGFKVVYKAKGYRVLSVRNSGEQLTIEEGNTSLENQIDSALFHYMPSLF
ncbi:VOC family protein [Viridibacillus arvi]|uniref:VOC family protein n=1 Tax=Viridibacillus arvi TaxID=263475 RepID=UPI003CFEB728